MIKQARFAPSILAADFSRLGAEVAAIEAHADLLHIDVMDGHFVPNISLGIPVVESLRPATNLEFDCHLMMTNPDAYLAPLKAAGADLVTVHLEVFPDPTDVAARARTEGLDFGLVINPPTPVEGLEPFLDLCDMVVVMSVHPGFGGQEFIEDSLDKIEQVRKMVDSRALDTDIEVDGGIGPDNVRRARQAGADVFVAGSSVFRADDPVAAIEHMRSTIKDIE